MGDSLGMRPGVCTRVRVESASVHALLSSLMQIPLPPPPAQTLSSLGKRNQDFNDVCQVCNSYSCNDTEVMAPSRCL